MALNLNEAIARVPMWANTSDLQISTLDGGITNSNYRIDIGGESFVLRIAGADTELLGITREYEYTANLEAGKLGIAPEVIYMIQPEGYLVTRFITARPFPPEEITQPENIRRVVEIVRKIHSMPEIPGTFSVFRTIEVYGEVARRYNVKFPEEFAGLMEQTRQAEAALKSESQALRPCHNDLLNANFLIDDRLYILDWEYAGMGDIFFDLANFSDHHELTDEQDQWLLECYFGEATDKQTAHLKIMKVMSDLREAMWAMVQIGISQLDFDYHSYANRFFGRVFENVNDPRWNEWINKLNNND